MSSTEVIMLLSQARHEKIPRSKNHPAGRRPAPRPAILSTSARHWQYLPSSSRETYKPTLVQGINLYPCCFCEHAVSWSPKEEAVCCDECSIWSCLEMCAKDYSLLQRSNVQWLCCRCQTLNISSFTFRSFEIPPSFYEPIGNENIWITFESVSATFNPLFTRSPKSTDHHMSENRTRRSNN